MPLTPGLLRATRHTDGKIQDKAIKWEVDAMENTERFQSHTRTVGDHPTESVGGIKKIEVLGALKLLSSGSASLAAVGDRHQGLCKSVSAVSQRLQAPRPGWDRKGGMCFRCCVTCSTWYNR
jgi:hypothetical protein